ncbi:glucose/arabinose dehydrogenase [Palleronia aestuarii]|uniref:Glucose/arabinose dehydrogenase n=1 Tax=Palleronia aestuarii TaxID=568105 RepID=A0A2W7NKE6_9RHOB|nr:sorbosone dehydrogenase family protein [Palleronia aestuarii]PZX19933.1 glucose/arabinose dehydrogenase [Palleronia aestuarii]
MRTTKSVVLAALLGLGACGADVPVAPQVGVGSDPALPAPRQTFLPTLNIAPATGWPQGEAPTAAAGLEVRAFAGGLDHPRWLHVLPNGDVLVAESNKQPAPTKGIRGFVEKQVMRVAGAEAPSADRIRLLRDADGDGVAEISAVLIDGLTSPFGMALMGGHLYIADTDALLRVPFTPGQTRVTAAPEEVVALPAQPPNRHWTKGLLAQDGALFVSVGSNSDHGENGVTAEEGRAAVWRVDPAAGAAEIFARGLRNPVGLATEPETGALWTVVNERDELGPNLVPDYLTRVVAGADYGWPAIYYGDRRDPRVEAGFEAPAEPRRPDFALGSHVAPLGLDFADGARLGPAYAKGAFIGEHGSWNRTPPSGYRVVFVPFAGGQPDGPPRTLLDGFVDARGLARGRPVGVAVAGDGALLVADDVGNAVWRVSRSGR